MARTGTEVASLYSVHASEQSFYLGARFATLGYQWELPVCCRRSACACFHSKLCPRLAQLSATARILVTLLQTGPSLSTWMVPGPLKPPMSILGEPPFVPFFLVANNAAPITAWVSIASSLHLITTAAHNPYTIMYSVPRSRMGTYPQPACHRFSQAVKTPVSGQETNTPYSVLRTP